MSYHPFKTRFVLAAFCLFLSVFQTAQAQQSKKSAPKKQARSTVRAPFHKGSNSLGIGLGVGADYNYYGDIQRAPTFLVTFDHGVKDHLGPGNLGLGGIVAMNSASYRYKQGGYKAVWRNYIIGARATWHLTILAKKNNKFDPYGGVMAGFRISDYSDSYYSNNQLVNPYNFSTVYPTVGAFVGAKYYVVPSFAAFAELGYDISLMRAGICLNF